MFQCLPLWQDKVVIERVYTSLHTLHVMCHSIDGFLYATHPLCQDLNWQIAAQRHWLFTHTFAGTCGLLTFDMCGLAYKVVDC